MTIVITNDKGERVDAFFRPSQKDETVVLNENSLVAKAFILNANSKGREFRNQVINGYFDYHKISCGGV